MQLLDADMIATLAEIVCQQLVVVESLCAGRLETQRLMDLGFVPGTTIRRVGQGPCGGPLVVEVRSARLAIRRDDARQIMVRATPSFAPAQ